MSLGIDFGFFGDAHADFDPQALHDYGKSGAAGPASLSPDQRRSATPSTGCWGGESEIGADFAVVVSGGPFARPGRAKPDPSSNPASEVARLYRERGEDAFAALDGCFSVAIFDFLRPRLLLAIDRFGISQLKFAVHGHGIVFSSSALVVAACPGVAARIRPQGLFDYLFHHMVPAPGSIFEGVHKLQPATFVSFERGAAAVKRYWAPSFAVDSRASLTELAGELRASIRTGVRDACPDEATGAFLSGGLDSSTVTAVLSEQSPRPAKTFSIGFGFPDYDELPYARIVSSHFHCDPHEHVVTGDDIVATIPVIARAFDEPFGNSSALPVYHCAALAKRNGVEHLLAGDGGDELFGGNSRYVEQRVFEWYRLVPAALRSRFLEPALLSRPWSDGPTLLRKARGYVEKAKIPLPQRLEMWNLLFRSGIGDVVHPDLLGEVSHEAPLSQMKAVWDSCPGDAYLHKMLYFDWHYTLAYNDLRKVETMADAAQVRVSYPMLHPAVVQLATRIPVEMMMPGTKLRHFYKQAMRGYLPADTIRKRKHGFGLPFGLWLEQSPRLREMVLGSLSGLRQRRIVSDSFIDKLLTLHGEADSRYYGVFIWILVALEQWLEEHRISV